MEYGNLYPHVSAALKEVKTMTTQGANLLVDFEDGETNWWDTERVKRTMIAFQGDTWKRPRDTPEWQRPRDQAIKKQPNFQKYMENVMAFERGLNGKGRPYDILCGDGHLKRYWYNYRYRDWQREKPSHGAGDFAYFDTFLNKWWPKNEEACASKKFAGSAVADRYVQLCAERIAETNWRITIGDDRKVDWTSQRLHGLDRNKLVLRWWAQWLVYTLKHELIHVLMEFDDVEVCGETAENWVGATSLADTDPHLCPVNVDSLGLPLLTLYLEGDEWSSGGAKNRETVRRELEREQRKRP
ncbi:hypothetical protein NUU61_005306 [Penicillium alfredii]|uniref:Uncharacterized protein n=1 Tax=Penicillium alfredii TaxID=1506179 RepID=A0A9W9F9E4_9EURO|nr:uncharacterized protein NUU61_005306 [Penicillium alfredii]KAJ5095950.1 hypothetical protein NUU61_005306 [Penicillium alfredii]